MSKIYIGEKEINAGGGSGSSFDPTSINSSIRDISTRLETLTINITSFSNETNASILNHESRIQTIETDYVKSNDISIYYTKSQINASLGEVEYALDGITDDIEHLDTNKADKTEVYTRNFIDTSINSLNTRIVDVSSYAQDVSARMPIFEYNSATQTLTIIA